MALALACLVALALLAGCGEDDEPAAPATELVVRVDRDGPRGPEDAREATVRCPGGSDACAAAAELSAADFAPVPGNRACTLQYGGPDTARVTGTLRGEEIDARFSRTDGCEIHRWETVRQLLDAAL
ncbi:MAG: SSI family serine proteinase inhibitor [Solirubrobacteraceae bacterium]